MTSLIVLTKRNTLIESIVVSLVAEIKVTHVGQRNGKWIVMIGMNDDPELEYDDENSETRSHYSLSSAINTTLDAVLKVDREKKWAWGLAKAIIYSQSAFEYCCCPLALVIVGGNMSRIFNAGAGCVFIECSTDFLSTVPVEKRIVSASDFFSANNSAHLYWTLLDDGFTWNDEGLDTLLAIHKHSVDILAHHMRTNPQDAFVPLEPLAGVDEAFVGLIEELKDDRLEKGIKMELDERNLQETIQRSRPLPRKRAPPSEPKASAQSDGNGDQDGRGEGPSESKRKRSPDTDGPNPGPRTRSAIKRAGTTNHEMNGGNERQTRSEGTSLATMHTGAAQAIDLSHWLNSIPSADMSLPELVDDEAAAPSSPIGPYCADNSLGDALEAADLHRAREVDDDLDSEPIFVLEEDDVLETVKNLGLVFVLASGAQMERIQRVMEATVGM